MELNLYIHMCCCAFSKVFLARTSKKKWFQSSIEYRNSDVLAPYAAVDYKITTKKC